MGNNRLVAVLIPLRIMLPLREDKVRDDMGPQGVGRGLGRVWEGSRAMDQRMALEPE